MPKKLTAVIDPFQNSQPMELKRILEPVMQAAMLSWQNVMVISEPGFGKTEILMAMLNQTFGEEHTMLFPCVPSTLPADIVGFANPIYSIDPDAEKNGVPYWIDKGTPVNKEIQACLLDEVMRFGDLGSDTAVHAMHNISRFHRPIYCATSNWLTCTPRTEALRDRFSFTVWYTPTQVDVRALVSTPKIQSWKFNLPTCEQVCEVNEWIGQYVVDPGAYKCNEAIMLLLEQIQKLCESTTVFRFNNRRVHQFRSILYGMGAYHAQANDFTELPREAFRALEHAYPVTDLNQALKWRQIVASVVDVVETEIAEFKANAYEAWQSIFAKYADRSGKVRQDGIDEMSQALGRAWASNEKLLSGQFPNDPRAQEALREMFVIYRALLQGKNPLQTVV